MKYNLPEGAKLYVRHRDFMLWDAHISLQGLGGAADSYKASGWTRWGAIRQVLNKMRIGEAQWEEVDLDA